MDIEYAKLRLACLELAYTHRYNGGYICADIYKFAEEILKFTLEENYQQPENTDDKFLRAGS